MPPKSSKPAAKDAPSKPGPKPGPAGAMRSQLNLRLTSGEEERWRAAAKDAGIDLASLIRTAVDAYLSDKSVKMAALGQAVVELVKERGL